MINKNTTNMTIKIIKYNNKTHDKNATNTKIKIIKYDNAIYDN